MIGLFALLAVYLSVFATGASAEALARRDKNLPARIPYVFPAPGTSAVSIVAWSHSHCLMPTYSSLTISVLGGLMEPCLRWMACCEPSLRESRTIVLKRHRLNAPAMAEGEDSLFGNIRDNNTLPAAMRELFILRTAVLNSATYQWYVRNL